MLSTRASMLPNLSSLSKLTLHVDVKRGREEAGLEILPNRSSTAVRKPNNVTREPLQNMDWKNLLEKMATEDDYTPIVFAVYIPRPGDKQWRVKFQLDFTPGVKSNFTLRIHADGTDKYCFEAMINNDKQDYTIKINSLFHALHDDTIALCNVKPNIKDNTGYGSAVLQVLDIIAGILGGNLSLEDEAVFRVRQPTVNIDERITKTLSLLRGFGFYEARGFIWHEIVDAEKDTSLYAAAEEVDLEWTHMVVTTPINQLQEAVRRFHTRVSQRLLIGNEVPVFTQRLYSEDFCKAHAERIEESVDRFKDFISLNFTEICPQRLGVQSYADASMRALAQATMSGLIRDFTWDAGDISTWLTELFDSVWPRPTTTNVDGKEVPLSYGDQKNKRMVKVLYESSDGSLFYNAVVPNPDIPRGVPVVRMQPLRTDVEVEYNTEAFTGRSFTFTTAPDSQL